jgi:hypothetical protein
MQEFIKRCREWQKQNADWELFCDMENAERLYTQWEDLPKNIKLYWTGKYRDDAREAFEEFGLKKCKVSSGVLDCNMVMHTHEDWPYGNAMSVYRTKVNGVAVI